MTECLWNLPYIFRHFFIFWQYTVFRHHKFLEYFLFQVLGKCNCVIGLQYSEQFVFTKKNQSHLNLDLDAVSSGIMCKNYVYCCNINHKHYTSHRLINTTCPHIFFWRARHPTLDTLRSLTDSPVFQYTCTSQISPSLLHIATTTKKSDFWPTPHLLLPVFVATSVLKKIIFILIFGPLKKLINMLLLILN